MASALLSFTASTTPILPFSINGNSLSLHQGLYKGLRSRLSRCGPALSVRGLGLEHLRRSRFQFSARSASDGGGFGGINGGGGGGGGGGDGAAEGGEARPAAVAPGAADDPVLSSDVIVLGVGGMSCGGCAESVRKILESQPQVSSASVDFKAETAIVWPVTEAKTAPNWRRDVGEALAKHLTNCGFKSNLKDESVANDVIQS